jgi:hypothetical protein
MLRVEAGTDAFVSFVSFVPGAADRTGNITLKNGTIERWSRFYGGEYEIRTRDLLHAMQAL